MTELDQTQAPPDLTEEEVDILTMAINGEKARLGFDLESYEAFHWCIYKHWLEPHEKKNLGAYFDEWRKPADQGVRGVLNKAARGTFKSTDTIGFLLFVIGHYPELSNLVIQARDKDTQKTHNFIADTIKSNKGWSACFPNVVPDEERGWSLNGCHVKKLYDLDLIDGEWISTDIPYEDWVQTITSDHKRDPTFLCVSVIAGAIGMHPTGCLVMDDIHDAKNTESMAEMYRVVSTVKSDIMPTMSNPGRKPILLVAYTPWKQDDTYAMLEKTGLFTQLRTPAFIYDPEGKYEFEGEQITLTCEKVYNLIYLEQQLKILGRREFNRQLLIILDIGHKNKLVYYTYELTGKEMFWPVTAGCDPNGVDKDRLTNSKQLSDFGIAYVGADPQGGAVVLDGFLEPCTYAEADIELMSAQDRFVGYQTAVLETVGSGAAYYAHARRDPNLKIVVGNIYSMKDEKTVKSKDDRIREMAVWFENGTVRIADKDTRFLNMLRFLFEHFMELDKNVAHPAWDAGDAVYQSLKGMPHVLQIYDIESEIRSQERHEKKPSPWASLGGRT